MIQSPLNYTGGKYKLLPQILPLFPKDINCFVDLFCGGCNVGINVCAKKYVYNDSCEPLINLYSVMQTLDSASFIEKIETVIKRYGLSDVKLYGYDFYNCNSSDGLGLYNRDKYMKLRADFNALKERNVDYYDIYNYRNSKHFIETVKEARRYDSENKKNTVIFAGACQSYFEAIISAGANFASSPARILIDFLDPIMVAEKIAITESYKYITMDDIASEIRDGKKGIDGIGSNGKMTKKFTIN